MIALADAVIPIIRLLVAVATRSGTPIARCITGTLMSPPPIPSRAETTPANDAAGDPRAQVGGRVVRTGQARRWPSESGAARRSVVRAEAWRGVVVRIVGPRASAGGGSRRRGARHREGGVHEQHGEQAGQDAAPTAANATSPPTSAPIAVNSSRVIPSRRFATWRSR